jgi:hypothetical protein
MKGVAEVHQICQSGNGLCLIVIFLMLLLPTRPTVAHSVRSSADPALAGTRGSDISENAGRKEPAIGFANRSEFPVWKTITVGVYKNVSAMREALDAAPCRIHVGSWADEILGRPEFPYVEAAAKLDLVVASVSALGFGEAGASLQDIYARASRLGLALGPAEIGPALRLGYLDQPLGEFRRIAMNPVARYGGEPVDFTIGNGGAGLLLIGGDFRNDLVVSGATRFVFVRPRARGRSFQAQGPGG